MVFKIHPLPSTPALKFLVKPKSESKVISKTLKIAFALVLVLFSLNLGFIRSPKILIVVKLWCSIQSLLVSFVFFFTFCLSLDDISLAAWYCMYLIEYCALVFGLLLNNKTTFYDFCEDLFCIDAEIGIVDSLKLESIIVPWISSCIAYRSLLSVIYCTRLKTYCIGDAYMSTIFGIPLLCGDVFLIIAFAIYYSLFYRLRAFTNFVANHNSDIVAAQYLYKSIADIAENIKCAYNPLYVLLLIFHSIDMMITVFYPILQMDPNEDVLVKVITANTSVIYVFFILFSPAFAAGLVSSQVDKLKLVLHDRLLQERDQNHSADLERFIRYIEVRSLKTIIAKVIHLDWQLPITIINLGVTYLIVMLQFAKK